MQLTWVHTLTRTKLMHFATRVDRCSRLTLIRLQIRQLRKLKLRQTPCRIVFETMNRLRMRWAHQPHLPPKLLPLADAKMIPQLGWKRSGGGKLSWNLENEIWVKE